MKHPVGRHACSDVLIHPPVCDSVFHPVIFDALNGAAIRSAALRTKGAAGPSGLDACGWRRLCTSFQAAPDDMCDGLALHMRMYLLCGSSWDNCSGGKSADCS